MATIGSIHEVLIRKPAGGAISERSQAGNKPNNMKGKSSSLNVENDGPYHFIE
jgi:hypothetical protein